MIDKTALLPVNHAARGSTTRRACLVVRTHKRNRWLFLVKCSLFIADIIEHGNEQQTLAAPLNGLHNNLKLIGKTEFPRSVHDRLYVFHSEDMPRQAARDKTL